MQHYYDNGNNIRLSGFYLLEIIFSCTRYTLQSDIRDYLKMINEFPTSEKVKILFSSQIVFTIL